MPKKQDLYLNMAIQPIELRRNKRFDLDDFRAGKKATGYKGKTYSYVMEDGDQMVVKLQDGGLYVYRTDGKPISGGVLGNHDLHTKTPFSNIRENEIVFVWNKEYCDKTPPKIGRLVDAGQFGEYGDWVSIVESDGFIGKYKACLTFEDLEKKIPWYDGNVNPNPFS